MPESALPISLTAEATDRFVDLDGERFLRIDSVDAMSPFLMSLVSGSDVWAFVASNGALTAGRRNADHALFPYYTEDRLVDDVANSGPTTLVRVESGPDAGSLWEPTSGFTAEATGQRWLAKSVWGDEIVFGEDRPDLGLSLRHSWTSSERFGLVRHCTLTNTGSSALSLRLLDGLINLVPAGASRQVQNNLSNLLDAYKFNEITGSGLGLYSLNSGLSDLAEPVESLTATVAWRIGPRPYARLCSAGQVDRFRRSGRVVDEPTSRGVRGAFLAAWELDLPAGSSASWITVADTDLDAAGAVDLRDALADPERLRADLEADLVRSRGKLRELMAGADALQLSADERTTVHHLASVTFNAMRGGLPIDSYNVQREHFREFVRLHSRRVADDHADQIDALPDTLTLADLHAFGERSGDPDLVRLSLAFLPLTFGRRHGDPSRPWNRFDIAVTDRQGRAVLGYQGNWRDIFQNWEALAWSYPDLVEGMIATFVNATTVDGYNPYRITHAGIDWEVPEPDNPWANIGYWNDHQIVYLARLVEVARRFHPGRLESYLNRALFTTADVPYRIAPFEAILQDPVDTIAFDTRLDEEARARAGREGADGLLRHDPQGGLQLTTLGDKLLLLLATKMVNFVPGAGIWMNTQRPEWNDANNALVGRGCSVVTTAQVLGFARQLVTVFGHTPTSVRSSLADLIGGISQALKLGAPAESDTCARRLVMQRLGEAGDRYRTRAYAGDSEMTRILSGDEIQEFLDLVTRCMEATVRSNSRPDGLFHSYNTLEWDESEARVDRLPLMLEGQVAVLSSGLLGPRESLALLDALRSSRLFRADQHSYLLYPDREVAGFLDKNEPPADALVAIAGLPVLFADPDQRVLVVDHAGGVHFAPGIANAKVLRERLDALGTASSGFTAEDRAALLALYEENFRHREFTGRSGSFFAYEGLGSIYWHMVSKLLLAVGEIIVRARSARVDEATLRELSAAYADIRAGLGFAKSARVFGAFPTDPYSHSPRHAGARQPGMTGQVKEDVLSRFGELGVDVVQGRITIRPDAIAATEWTAEPAEFTYVDASGLPRTLSVPAGAMAFTLCQVPFVVEPDGRDGITLVRADGSERHLDGHTVPVEDSQRIFARDGAIAVVRVGAAPGVS